MQVENAYRMLQEKFEVEKEELAARSSLNKEVDSNSTSAAIELDIEVDYP